MRKPTSMVLEDWRNVRFNQKDQEFKILKVKNSTDYVAGDHISLSDVDVIIQAGWDVAIQPKK